MQILQVGESDMKSVIALLFLVLITGTLLICFFSLEKIQQSNLVYLEKVINT